MYDSPNLHFTVILKVGELKELERKMNVGLEKLAEAAESVDQLSKELVVKEKDLEVANKAADKVRVPWVALEVILTKHGNRL